MRYIEAFRGCLSLFYLYFIYPTFAIKGFFVFLNFLLMQENNLALLPLHYERRRSWWHQHNCWCHKTFRMKYKFVLRRCFAEEVSSTSENYRESFCDSMHWLQWKCYWLVTFLGEIAVATHHFSFWDLERNYRVHIHILWQISLRVLHNRYLCLYSNPSMRVFKYYLNAGIGLVHNIFAACMNNICWCPQTAFILCKGMAMPN